jgi:hypothetical protein
MQRMQVERGTRRRALGGGALRAESARLARGFESRPRALFSLPAGAPIPPSVNVSVNVSATGGASSTVGLTINAAPRTPASASGRPTDPPNGSGGRTRTPNDKSADHTILSTSMRNEFKKFSTLLDATDEARVPAAAPVRGQSASMIAENRAAQLVTEMRRYGAKGPPYWDMRSGSKFLSNTKEQGAEANEASRGRGRTRAGGGAQAPTPSP